MVWYVRMFTSAYIYLLYRAMAECSTNLTLLPFCPQLRMIEVLQEDKAALAFTTEPVLCSLGDLLHQVRATHGVVLCAAAYTRLTLSPLFAYTYMHTRISSTWCPTELVLTPVCLAAPACCQRWKSPVG